jgi:hypothetical protein
MSVLGCAGPATLAPKSELLPKATPEVFSLADWATVLRENVKEGLVDYDHLSRRREALDRFIALISVVGPSSTPGLFPTTNHRIAYRINAYNAQVLNIVLSRNPKETIHEVGAPDFRRGYRFRVDGQQSTLAQLEAALLEDSGQDVRIFFTLSEAAMGGPDLSNQPYRVEALERELTHAVRTGLARASILQVNHENRKLLVWLRILSNQEEFIKFHQRQFRTRGSTLLSALLELSDDRRRSLLNTAVGYQVGTVPFDRRLNRWRSGMASAS